MYINIKIYNFLININNKGLLKIFLFDILKVRFGVLGVSKNIC